jgi:hypothetical protein
VGWELVIYERKHGKPRTPCTVVLKRCAPSRGLDDDNLTGSLKAVRDAVAEWLGVDDRDRATVRYQYEDQRTKGWAVVISFHERPEAA